MADYYPLIARAVAGLPQNTGEARRALYERARNALVTQLRGRSESEIARERDCLEAAIRRIETEIKDNLVSPVPRPPSILSERPRKNGREGAPAATSPNIASSPQCTLCGGRASDLRFAACGASTQWVRVMAMSRSIVHDDMRLWKIPMCAACLPAGYENYLKNNIKSIFVGLGVTAIFLVASVLILFLNIIDPNNAFMKLLVGAGLVIGILGVPTCLLMLVFNFFRLKSHQHKGTVPLKQIDKAFIGEGQRIIKSIETDSSNGAFGNFDLPVYGTKDELPKNVRQLADLKVERRWRDIVAVGRTLEDMIRALPSNWKAFWEGGRSAINKLTLSEPEFLRLALAGNDAELKKMINAGQDVNQISEYGFTALHAAGYGGKPSSVELLCKAGSNPNAASKSGLPPMMAVLLGHEHKMFKDQSILARVLSILLNHGADPNWTFTTGVGYLHLTAKKNQWNEATRLLLSHGANPNAKADGRVYPIHVAAVEGNVDAAKALVSAGVDVNVTDAEGRSAEFFSKVGPAVFDVPEVRRALSRAMRQCSQHIFKRARGRNYVSFGRFRRYSG